MKLIRETYSNNVILQRLIKIKQLKKRWMSINIIKTKIKLKLKQCEIRNNLF